MKEGCSSSLDRISNLPSHISQIILVSLPLRDMARTSIFSKSWRYQWLKVPQLSFMDDPKYAESQEERYIYSAMEVFGILLGHHGPISKFTLDMNAWLEFSEIDTIIPVLSRNGIQELTLLFPFRVRECFKLPSSILSCVELRHLNLSSCVFKPFTIVGFSKLVSLELWNVSLDLDVSLSSCPLLESLSLKYICGDVNLLSIDAPNLKKFYFEGDMTPIGIMNAPGNRSSDLISLLHSFPLLEELCLDYNFLQVLTEGDSSVKFPLLLDNLRTLELSSVDVRDMRVLSSTLCLLRSSPNLLKLKFSYFGYPTNPLATLTGLRANLILLEHDLLKLKEVEIILFYNWSDLRQDMEFFKFLLDISPALKKLYIKAYSNTIDVNGYKMLVELACYGRASQKSEIVYAGVDLS